MNSLLKDRAERLLILTLGVLATALAFACLFLLFLLLSSAANAAEPRAAMQIALVYDTDVSQQSARFEVDRAVGVIGRQLPLDITVYVESVAHVADDTNPSALVNAVSWYASNQTYSKRVGVTVFLTKRVLGVGSQRFRGFTYLGSAYSGGAVVIQMIGDGYDYEVIAHEIAHTLNAPHDGEGACKDEPNPFGFIMQAYMSGSEVFSECSLREIKSFLTARSDVFYPAPPPPPVQNLGRAAGSFDDALLGFLLGVAFFAYAQRRR